MWDSMLVNDDNSFLSILSTWPQELIICHFFKIIIYVCVYGHFYYPPMKLREGNVFTHVCHSVHSGGGGGGRGQGGVWCHSVWLPGLMFFPQCLPSRGGLLTRGYGGLSTRGMETPQYWHLVSATNASYWSVFLSHIHLFKHLLTL